MNKKVKNLLHTWYTITSAIASGMGSMVLTLITIIFFDTVFNFESVGELLKGVGISVVAYAVLVVVLLWFVTSVFSINMFRNIKYGILIGNLIGTLVVPISMIKETPILMVIIGTLFSLLSFYIIIICYSAIEYEVRHTSPIGKIYRGTIKGGKLQFVDLSARYILTIPTLEEFNAFNAYNYMTDYVARNRDKISELVEATVNNTEVKKSIDIDYSTLSVNTKGMKHSSPKFLYDSIEGAMLGELESYADEKSFKYRVEVWCDELPNREPKVITYSLDQIKKYLSLADLKEKDADSYEAVKGNDVTDETFADYKTKKPE